MYLFSRFLLGVGLRTAADLDDEAGTPSTSSCFTVGDAVAGDDMGLGYSAEGTVSKSDMRGISNCARHVRSVPKVKRLPMCVWERTY